MTTSVEVGVTTTGFIPQANFSVVHDGSGFVDGATITITDLSSRFGSKPHDPKPLFWLPCDTDNVPSSLGRITSATIANTGTPADGNSRYEGLTYSSTGGVDGGGKLLGNSADGLQTTTDSFDIRIHCDEWTGSDYVWNDYNERQYIFRKCYKNFGHYDTDGTANPDGYHRNIKEVRMWPRNPSTGGALSGETNYYVSASNGAVGVEYTATQPYQNWRLGYGVDQLGWRTAMDSYANQWYTDEVAFLTNDVDQTHVESVYPDAKALWRTCGGVPGQTQTVNNGDWWADWPNYTWMWNHLKWAESGGSSTRIMIVQYVIEKGNPVTNPDRWPLQAGEHMDYDDVYVDDSWCRVMIGDSATYNSHTMREVQIPVTWNAGQITAILRKGQFEGYANKHLFVVDNDDTRYYIGNFD